MTDIPKGTPKFDTGGQIMRVKIWTVVKYKYGYLARKRPN